MASATLTLMGLYNYDNTIFDGLTLPEGIEKSTLVANILLRSGDFECIYPDPDFLKSAITLWGKKWQRTFIRWIDALNIDYDPLENYNRYEHWTDAGEASGESDGTSGSTNTGKTSAYDQADFSNHDQTVIDASDHTETSSSNASEHDGRIHGNIGVTTSQQMLLSELDLGYWNIYEKITDVFLTEFVLPIY